MVPGKKKTRPRLLGSLISLIAAFILCFGLYLCAVIFLLPYPELENGSIYKIDNIMIRELEERQIEYVPFEKLPESLIKAFVAIEDSRFFEHRGIDLVGLVRAMTVNISSGEVVQGGSTITQQLAKNLFLENDRTISRKAKEMALALKLETEYSKEEILAMYLNQIYFGNGKWGIGSAARSYFNKDVPELTLGEAAMLAGIVQAPSIYAPAEGWKSVSIQRQKAVLNRMVELEYITTEEAAQAAFLSTAGNRNTTKANLVDANDRRPVAC